MEFFLPIAEVNVSLPFIFFLSLVVGILSGLFGVGGGFLMTPFLIFLGIPPAYAVPNEANNILGTSISGSTKILIKVYLVSMLEYFQKHTNSFKHIFNLKIISNLNTKIALYIGLAAYWVVMLSSTFFGF